MTIISTSTAAFFERARQGMTALRSEAEDLQAQLGTGNRLTRSSDDPVAASRLRNIGRLTRLSEVDTANAQRANADLTLADAAIANVADAVIRAQELATQAAGSGLTAQQRAAIATELAEINNHLFSLANARDSNGNALFGGSASGAAYTRDAGGNAVYVGSASAEDLPLGEGQSVTRSLTGPEFLQFQSGGSTTSLMATLKALSDALAGGSPDPAGAARSALATLADGLDAVTTAQTVVGSRLAWIEMTGERRVDMGELRTTEEADLGATDIAGTVARLQQTMLVLEASQASFGKLSSLSLFDALR